MKKPRKLITYKLSNRKVEIITKNGKKNYER